MKPLYVNLICGLITLDLGFSFLILWPNTIKGSSPAFLWPIFGVAGIVLMVVLFAGGIAQIMRGGRKS